MHANLTHLFVFFCCLFDCQLVKYLFLRSFKRTVLLSWGSFSENQVSICQKQRMLSRSCFASFDFPVCLSRLICYYPHPISIIKLLICYYPLLPLMLHYRLTAMFDLIVTNKFSSHFLDLWGPLLSPSLRVLLYAFGTFSFT